jgi:hypothetical protein
MTGPCDKPRYIPLHPTKGWMVNELEDLGVPVRGKVFSDEQLAAMLRERGYEVSGKAAPKPEQKNDR